MIGKWLHNIMNSIRPETSTQAADQADKDRQKKDKLIDVPHQVLSEYAAKRHAELKGLTTAGLQRFRRDKFKNKVKQKVWDVVGSSFELDEETSDDMIEEITERIVEAAESDPSYVKMFDGDDNQIG